MHASVDLEQLAVTDEHRGGGFKVSGPGILLVLAILAALSFGGYQLWVRFRPRVAVDIVQVVAGTGTVTRGGGSFEAAGWIEPDPFPSQVSPLVESRVAELHVVEGDKVKEGQLLVSLLEDDNQIGLDAAIADQAEAVAELKAEQAEHAINIALNDEGVLDDLALVRSSARVDAAQARVLAAKAAVAQAELDLRRCQVKSPIDGVILRRSIAIGDHVSPGGHGKRMLTIYDPLKIQVRVDVNLADVPKAGVGTKCELQVDAVANRTFKGVVHRINHEADNQKNTVQFKVKILEPDPLLKPEMLCRVRFMSPQQTVTAEESSETIHFLPEAVVQDAMSDPYVYVIKGESPFLFASRVAVKVGNARKEDLIEVIGGVDLSSKVIASGFSGLKDGEPVQVAGGDPWRPSK